MSDLATWLLRCIEDDERVAREATAGPWRYNPRKEWHTDLAMLARARAGRLTFDGEEFVGAGPEDETTCVAATGPSDEPQSMADAAHIARWDPARVLAECAAKRRIVEIESRWRRTKDIVVTSSGPDYDARMRVTWDKGGGHLEHEIMPSKEFQDRFTEPSPPSEILRLLAQPYRDRDGYDASWDVQ
ncbi:MAG: DUF6221 family protein [Blastococcus sp.]